MAIEQMLMWQKIKEQAQRLCSLQDSLRCQVLQDVADSIEQNCEKLLEANKCDLKKMDPEDPKYDRLLLTKDRLQAIAQDVRSVAEMETVLGKNLEEKRLENGLLLRRETAPLGVVGVIYEARPNVTFDVFALCFRSGNVAVLKGGSDAIESNKMALCLIHQVLDRHQISSDALTLLPATRKAAKQLCQAQGFVDVVIPRGSQALIDSVREQATVAVIETGAGIVHTYVDQFADREKATKIVANAKLRRVSVCNALDCLLLHKDRLKDLAVLVHPLQKAGVLLHVDQPCWEALQDSYPGSLLKKATSETYGREFLSLQMAIKLVKDSQEAIEHIHQHSSQHSEAIISEDQKTVEEFTQKVDAAVVYVNASTAFTDGAQFGMGSEIGISTQKLHARGPMGLRELTTYKWVVQGDGQIRD